MHIIKVCVSCSCEKAFAQEVLQKAEKVLGIQAGETTPDGRFRLEKTGCLSQCESAPSVLFAKATSPLSMLMIDGEVKTNMLPHRLEKELEKLKMES